MGFDLTQIQVLLSGYRELKAPASFFTFTLILEFTHLKEGII